MKDLMWLSLQPVSTADTLALMSSGGRKSGCPSLWREVPLDIASKSVYGQSRLVMDGDEEGVATAAIVLSTFFIMIVWKVVFTMMGMMGVPDRVWKLQASFVFPFVTILS